MRRFLNPVTLIMIIAMAYMAVSGGRYDNPGDWFIRTLMLLPGILIALSFHEFAHAAVAYKLGDDTPKRQRRVTVNPAAHLDLVGMLCLVFIGFGWGKPVMVDPRNFKSPRRDEFMVSIAGVAMNLLLAFLFGAVLGAYDRLAPAFAMSRVGGIIAEMLFNTVYINIVLMIFNLIPVPPLDGFNVLSSILNIKHTEVYWRIYQNGMVLLLILIIFNVVNKIFDYTVIPIFYFILRLFL